MNHSLHTYLDKPGTYVVNVTVSPCKSELEALTMTDRIVRERIEEVEGVGR